MPDPVSPLILDALTRAVADPNGMLLHGNKSTAGLFTATSSARKAAQLCKGEGWLRVVRTEARGKSTQEVCALTEKGLAYLLGHVEPQPILQQLLRAVDERRTQLAELIDCARQAQAGLDALRTVAEQTLHRLPANGHGANHKDTANVSLVILAALTRWVASGAIEDCALPDLYRQVSKEASLTIGQFHDALRLLHEQQSIALHPWTGPLYELPEPACALLVGHEVAYYASKR